MSTENQPDSRPLRIGVVCYPTQGGSGVVATELTHALADRGHEMHVVSYDVPARLDTLHRNVTFHPVHVPEYPLFEYPPYSLALAAQLAEVVCRHHLDVVHVHYAMPHAIGGWLARRIAGRDDLPLITTLHGTDITIVGNDPSYLPVTKLSVEVSDTVTVVSDWLRGRVNEVVGCECDSVVIHNFVDGERFRPLPREETPLEIPPEIPVLMHLSNFRPVKRIEDVVDTFLKVRGKRECRLVLVGDGPDRIKAERRLAEAGRADDALFLGPQSRTELLLPAADLFLFPSNAESFGLAALEAMACGVPVIGARAGGLVEVVEEGVTGSLLPVGDTEAMAAACLRLLEDPDRLRNAKEAARARALEHFSTAPVVDRYEEIYWSSIRQVLREGPVSDEMGSYSPCGNLPEADGRGGEK